LPDLPLLKDVLVRYQERAFLDVELKVGGLENITAELLGEHPPHRGFVISSFLPEVLLALRGVDSAMPLGIICETKAELGRWREMPVEYVIPHQKLVNQGLARELKAAGKRIFVWTVNSPAEMRRFADAGVDGIISDETGVMCSTL
jgi:glycerophosphoryl diester phosphodiesterase